MPTVDYERRVGTAIERVEMSADIHPDNKAAIKEFKRDLKLDGMSDAWLGKLVGHLYTIAEHVGDTRFEDIEKDGMKDIVEWLQDRKKENGDPVSDATINAYKQVIKRFWRWLYNMPSGSHPEVTAWINTTLRNDGNGKLPKDLLTPDDVEALKDACRNKRDRAFIALLYETGARIGELIDLTVGDIEDHRHGRKVVIDGKTGQRRLPLVESAPALNKWLNEHPTGAADDPLWCKLRAPEQVSYHYIRQKLLVRAGKRAAESDPSEYAGDSDAESPEFYKPLNPHHFRHSRASHLANKFTEAQLCAWFGWVQGSDVPAKYVHLSGRDIDDAYFEQQGLKTAEEAEDERRVVQCWRCEEVNEAGDRFCSGCGATLDVDAAVELEDAEAKTTDETEEDDLQLALRVVEAMRSNPEEVEAFVDDLGG